MIGSKNKPGHWKKRVGTKIACNETPLFADLSGDINGDGRNDVLVTEGWWEAGENRKQENWKFHPANFGPAVVYWFEIGKKKDGQWKLSRHLIDDDSGLGTQFDTADLNVDGKIDIAGANKKGVFVFIQK